MLDDERYREIVDAFRERFPDSEALIVAAGDAGLREYCKTKSPHCRIMARKALMAQNWIFKGRVASDEEAFWRDLSIKAHMYAGGTSGSEPSDVTGVLLGGTWVRMGKSLEFIQRQLELNVLMDSLGTGQAPIIKKVGGEAERLRKAILAELEGKYGGH